ncbi:MAG TPA: LysR family transcriptional regulator [Burkholderiaceae bacterium]
MKVETFHTLHAVILTGSLAKAAQLLNLTPSAVSMQMKQLEEYMGAALFDRSSQTIRPVRLAHEVVEVMGAALERIESLRQRPDIQVQGIVRLGIVDTMLPLLLPRTLSRAQTQYPSLQVQVARGKSKTLMQQIRSAELDVAVLAQPADGWQTKTLAWQPLLQRRFVLLAPPASEEGRVAALLASHKIIGYDRQTVTGAMASRYLAERHGIRRLDLEFDSVPAIISMVGLGMGVSVLQIADPRLLQTDPVRVVELGRDAPRIQYSLLSRAADLDKRNLQAIVQMLLDVGHEAE